MTIRPFSPDTDYPLFIEMSRAIFPEYPPDTEEQMRFHDARRDPKCKWGRFVGEENGRAVATGDFGQSSGMYHPQKFNLWVSVWPEAEGRGYGKAMYEHLANTLAPFDPIALMSSTREDRPRPRRFLEERGFAEKMRYSESHLPVDGFDFGPYDGAEEKAQSAGITIRTLTQLEQEDTEGVKRKFYDLVQALHHDVPSPERPTDVPFDVWVQRWENPDLLPDANFIALDGDKYVGLSNMWRSTDAARLNTGLTGVLPSHRRRGIALALKLRAIRFAKEYGAKIITTGNEVNNRAMLSINERLGFEKQPEWIDYTKVIKADKDETPLAANE